MARNIDKQSILDQTLSLDDVKYLLSRGRLPSNYPIPEDLEPTEPVAPETAENMNIQSYATETKVVPLDEQDTITIGDNGGIVDDEDENSDDSDDDSEEDYLEGWTNDRRRAELSRRGLSINGKLDDLVARLRRSDADTLIEDDYVEVSPA